MTFYTVYLIDHGEEVSRLNFQGPDKNSIMVQLCQVADLSGINTIEIEEA